MAAELAIIGVLKNDSFIQSKCATRLYLNKRPQNSTIPSIVVRRYGTTPNDTKDGPSELDETRVQVLIYVGELTYETYLLEQRVREVLDHFEGFVNGVNVQGCSYEDDDMYPEMVDNKEVNVFEHIYKTLIRR